MRSLFFVLVIGIMGCSACLDDRPKGVLPEKEMTRLMTEVHLLDGYLSTLSLDSSKKIIDTLYSQLLAKYGLDSVSFSKNVDYYYADPKKTEAVYSKITEDLQDREKAYLRRDSIRMAVERDSMNRVQRYQSLLGYQHRLTNVFHEPDSMLTINEYHESLYANSGLYYLWRENVPANQFQRLPNTHRQIPPRVNPDELHLQRPVPVLPTPDSISLQDTRLR